MFTNLPQEEKAALVGLIVEAIQVNERLKNNDRCYSINAVAHRLKRSHATISRLVKAGIIKGNPDGSVSERAINDYLQKE